MRSSTLWRIGWTSSSRRLAIDYRLDYTFESQRSDSQRRLTSNPPRTFRLGLKLLRWEEGLSLWESLHLKIDLDELFRMNQLND
jgi:hypothetical protein